MSVDHKLYLWNFEEEDILIDLEMASMQSIVSVGIAKPKRGTTSRPMCLCDFILS